MSRKKRDPSTDFRDNPKKDDGSDSAWWPEEMAEGRARGEVMVEVARQIEGAPSELMRQDLNLLYGSMYEGTGLSSLYQYGGKATLQAVASGVGWNTGDVTWNQVRSVVQTVTSQVARSKPRARFVTTGGNWRQRQKAKKLTQLCDGVFASERVYEKTQKAFTQAGAFDVAGIEVSKGADRPIVSNVLATEILIDANDGIYGTPRSLYRRKFIDRGIVMRTYGKTAAQQAAIGNAKEEDPAMQGGRPNLIEVYEAWHLPNEKGGKDGRHVIAIGGEGGTLVDEVYRRDYFPIFLFAWDPALSGPYGRSAAEVLLPNQIAINTLLDKIARAQHLACVPRVGVQRGSKIVKSEITNGIGSVIQFGTMPPVWWSPTALSPEVYQHLERHWNKGFETYGVSPFMAGGQKASGVTSGEAIRESLDVQTARFAVLAQRWEQLHLDVARAIVDTCRELYADNAELRIAAPGTQLLNMIQWKDVDLAEDVYVIQPYPTSILPTTPQGRIDRIKELTEAGIWSQQRAEAALDDLDVDANMSAERAAEKEIEQICENMLMDGEYEPPDPVMDLAACLRIGNQYRACAREGAVPDKHIDLVYRFMDDAAALQEKIKPPPAPAAMPGAPGAPAAPMPMAA
jgi:hypothetical protein